MRGRTNILQRSGTAPVNGQVKQYEVATGNTISVGDFVSFTRNVDEPVVVMNSEKLKSFQIYVNESTFLQKVFLKNSVVVSIVSNGVVKDTMTLGKDDDVVYLQTLGLVVAINPTAGTTSNCNVYSISDSFKFVTVKTLSSGFGYCQERVFSAGNKIVMFYAGSSSSTTAYLYSVSLSGEITLVNSFALNGSYVFTTYGVSYFSNGILSVLHYGTSSDTNLKFSYFSVTDDSISLINMSSVVSNLIGGNKYERRELSNVTYIDSENICFTYQNDTYGTIVVLSNVSSNKLVNRIVSDVVGYPGDGVTSGYPRRDSSYSTSLIPISESKFLAISASIFYNNDFYTSQGVDNLNESTLFYSIFEVVDGNIVRTTDWLQLYSWNEIKLFKYSNRYYNVPVLFLPSLFYFYKDGDNYKLYFGITQGRTNVTPTIYYDIYSIVNLNFKFKNDVVGDVTNKVMSYNGGALGFAKTGGDAGETIEVYVPYES